MLSSELDSFILKFKSLWHSGIDAHLDVDTHAGQAWVGLRVGLGHLHHHHVQRKKESPSRQRRRARRAEARRLAAEVADNEEPTVVVALAEKVTVSDDAVKAECFISGCADNFVARLLDDMTYVRPDEFLAALPVWVTED